MSNSNHPFSTTFTVREHLLTQNAGVKPISQVMGTAFVSLPRNKSELLTYVYGPNFGNILSSSRYSDSRYNTSYLQPVVGEIDALTSLRSDVRKRAIDRMYKEAVHLKADGVVAVRMKCEVHNWGDCLTLECTVIGTAIKLKDWHDTKPFLSLMPAQQFWRLWQSGFEPCGIAIGACSYSDCVEASVLQRTRNQEVGAYTVSFYDAHELAMKDFTKNVSQHEGSGAVGMEIEFEFEDLEKELEVREGQEIKYMHLLTHFVIMGTAIRKRGFFDAKANPHQRTLRILDLSNFKAQLAKGSEVD